MPPAAKRRRTSGPASAAQQGTLKFRSSKASAAGGSPHIKQANSLSKPAAKAEVVNITTDEEQVAQEPPAIDLDDPSARIFQAAEAQNDQVDEEMEEEAEEEKKLEKKALALPETKLKAYWAAKEKERKAPRVHQKDLTMREKMLREWDMSSRYGPSIGITRLARWRRAQRIGMDPPIEILAVLLKEQQSARDGKNKEAEIKVQRSVMDDLIMSSRMRGEAMLEA